MNKNVVVKFVRTKSLIYSFYCNITKWNPYMINIAIALLIYVILVNYYLVEISFCDSDIGSGSDVSEFHVSQTREDNSDLNGVVRDYSPTLLFKLRRRVYWFLRVGNSKEFASYSEFKLHWNPETSIRHELSTQFKNMIKNPAKDLSETRAQVHIDLERSREATIRASEPLARGRLFQSRRRLDRINELVRRK